MIFVQIITTKFELDVARGLWGDARTSFNSPSRRKKRRKTYILLPNPDNPSKKHKIPASKYPAPIVFYHMHQAAGILQGLPKNVDLSKYWKMIALSDDEKNKKFKEEFGFDLIAQFKHIPDSFGRLIAKIGYGQALFYLDLDDFRPICLPYILGKEKNLSYVVGGQSNIPEPNKDMGYVLGNGLFGTREKLMIISEVRLFANNEAPVYHVVVGDVSDPENVEKVIHKFGQVVPVIFPTNQGTPGKSLDDCHWMPLVWPLPFWGT